MGYEAMQNKNAQLGVPSGKGAGTTSKAAKANSAYAQDLARNVARQNTKVDEQTDVLDHMLKILTNSYPNG